MSFTLTYGIHSIELRSPDLGNTDTIKTGAVVRQTRGGDLKGYKSDEWPKVTNRKYSFVILNESVKDDLEDFLNLAKGQLVSIIDYDANAYDGYILNSTVQFITIVRDIGWTIELETMEVTP